MMMMIIKSYYAMGFTDMAFRGEVWPGFGRRGSVKV